MGKITLYSDVNEVKKSWHIAVEQALERIKKGNSRVLVEKIRLEKDKKKRNLIKMNLPCICFSGFFNHRSKQGVISHSGFICLDFDQVDINVTKEQLKGDKFIYAYWTSPSGTGVKALVKIPPIIDKHGCYFDALKEKYPLADPLCRNIDRVCYESWDPELYINVSSEVWDKMVERQEYTRSDKEPQLPIDDEGEIIKRIVKWAGNKGESFTTGSRNRYITVLAGAMNRFGISQYTAESYLTGYEEEGFSKEGIIKSVKSVYSGAKNVHNTAYFENISLRDKVRDGIRSKVEDQQLVEWITSSVKVTEEKAVAYVEQEKVKGDDKLEVFWHTWKDDKGKVKIELVRKKFIGFLVENGFHRYRLSDEYLIYIRIYDNQVEQVYPHNIKNFVFQWIDRLEDKWFDSINKHILYEFIAKGIKTYFEKDLLDLLPVSDVKLNTDTATVAYFYYFNGAVEVTKDKVQLVNYCDLNGNVWKNQINPRHFVLLDDCFNNSYCKFLDLITPEQNQKDALVSVIGYLLHKYKDKRITKAPILTDRQSNDNPEGGSGKGLIVDGIRQIRKVVTMDGKNFKGSKDFKFQRVEVDTELIFIDDLPKGFEFEQLFSIITEGIPVEKKNKGEFFIPFESSPKVVMATNYYLKGEGSSNNRRKVDVEINNYFNAKYTPFDEFGETLFTDWNNNTWNDFDNSMMRMCKFYLDRGIIAMTNESIEAKKLQANTCHEFVEFSSDIELNAEINRRTLFDSFISIYPGFTKIHMRTFIKWIESFASHRGYIFNKDHRRSHNDFFIYISTTGSLPVVEEEEPEVVEQQLEAF